MTPRYMSAMYKVPSGALAMPTGRNSGSSERMNSERGYTLCSCVSPSVVTGRSRRTERATVSP